MALIVSEALQIAILPAAHLCSGHGIQPDWIPEVRVDI